MENASKALIIAGAILLSILLISLGIMVYNNAKNTVGNANLSKEEIAAFNSQWEVYTGSGKTASEVRTLLSAIIASNTTEKKNLNRIVKVTYAADLLNTGVAAVSNAEPTTVPAVSASKTFTITPTYTNGYITLITIT